MLLDSLTNLVTGLGTDRDRGSYDTFNLRELTETELDAMVDGDWVARKIVELPVRDMVKAWRTWSDKTARVNAFEEAEKRHAVRRKLARAMMLARRYGGSAILIGADTADPSKPLRAESVGKGGLKYLTVLRRREITPGEPDRDPESPTYGEPAYYTLNTSSGSRLKVHPSRVIRFVGAPREDVVGDALGWGYSALQAPYDAVRNAASATSSASAMLHDAKIDIVHVDNLGTQLSTQAGTSALQKRFGLANLMKSIHSMLLLDKNETHERVQTSFNGVTDLLSRFLSVAAAAADIPASRFLSQSSSSGLNSSGETDLRHYYDHLASERERVLIPVLDRLDGILWRDATGRPPSKGVTYQWDALWQQTDRERADTQKIVADIAKTYVDAGLVDEMALAASTTNALIESGLFPGLEQALASSALSSDPDLGDGDDEREEAKKPARIEARDTFTRRLGSRARSGFQSGGSRWVGSTAPAF